MEVKERICPRCHRKYNEYPALSRRDNRTYICPECGRTEAYEDFYRWEYKGERYWKYSWEWERIDKENEN